MFSSFLTQLNIEDQDFTAMSCKELIKYIEEIPVTEETELLKLFSAIEHLLNIKDQCQIMRFEILIGYPQIIVDESTNPNVPFPKFGYHKITDLDSKYIEFRGLFNTYNTSCFMKKFYSLKKSKLQVDMFLLIMNACSYNQSLLKYIFNMPSEDCKHEE